MLKLSPLFTDGAVLCRRKEIRIFGEADGHRTVTVCLRDARSLLLAEAVAEVSDGRFLACLPPQEARTGCVLTVRAGDEELASEDISIGDVFLAGGQSNMELELRNAQEGEACLAHHEDAQLRFFDIPRKAFPGPEQRAAVEAVRWDPIRPGEGGQHSAVAYFFAMALRKKHPEIPVGIIGCYWGGTSILCWLEEDTLRRSAEGARFLENYAGKTAGKTMEQFLKEDEVFQRNLNDWNREVAAYRQAHPEAEWLEVEAACGACPWNPPDGPGSPYRPCGLAESMLRVAEPVSLTAILYYQGETDAGVAERYDELMALLVSSWRSAFADDELPFLFVQLPMWRAPGAEPDDSWPRLRMQQSAARNMLRGTGMVCLLDQGEYGNLHPTAKRVVGERLHDLAESMLYGEQAPVSPRAVRKYTAGDAITVILTEEIVPVDGKPPRHLEIAGADGCFHPAFAVASGNTLRLWSREVGHPVHVRYAWTDWAGDINLFGVSGLPVEPFVF